MYWAIAAAIIAIIVWYALAGRAWLKSKSWTQGFFALVEPVEIALYKKSETILMARVLSIGGFIVTIYDGVAAFVTSLDLTPITTRVFDALHIPQDMRSLAISAFISAIGLMIAWLRKRVSKPLELVAVPEAQITPAASVAMANAEIAKDKAVAAVAEAKAP